MNILTAITLFACGTLTSFITHELGHYIGFMVVGVPRKEMKLSLTSVSLSERASAIVLSKNKIRQIFPVVLGPVGGIIGGLLFSVIIPKKNNLFREIFITATISAHIMQFFPVPAGSDGSVIVEMLSRSNGYIDDKLNKRYTIIIGILATTTSLFFLKKIVVNDSLNK